MNRNERLLSGLTKTMRGLEIGASFSPVASKADGWNIAVVDHATRDALKEKYRDAPGIDVSRIEDVDFVWNKLALHDCFGAAQHHTFDFCIASHLVEHIPDLVTFLGSIETLFTKHGILSLAVPDKRYSFDAMKPFTTTADLLAVHSLGGLATRHSAKTKYENIAYNVVGTDEARGWGQQLVEDLRIYSPHSDTKGVFEAKTDPSTAPYEDAHAWYFTPSSFRLLMLELRALGKTRFVVESMSEAIGCEFFARLRLDDAPPAPVDDEQRLALLVSILAEQADQYSLISPKLWERLVRALPSGHPVPPPPAHVPTISRRLASLRSLLSHKKLHSLKQRLQSVRARL